MFGRTVFLVCILSAMALGDTAVVKSNYSRIDLRDFVAHPVEYQGRRVTITAEVVSVSADYLSMDLFDSNSKTLVVVSLARLTKSQRQALVTGPVTRVTAQGRIEMQKGRTLLQAEKVSIVSPEVLAMR